MDAVGTDKQVAVHRHRGVAVVSVREVHLHAVRPLREASEAVASDDASMPESGADGLKEEHLQLAAVDRVLWPPVAGIDAARFRPDRFAAFGEVAQIGGGHARGG